MLHQAVISPPLRRPGAVRTRVGRVGAGFVFTPYYPSAIHLFDALINLLRNAERPLSQHEQGMIPELEQLKQSLADGRIEPPLMSYLPDYPHFRKVFRLTKSSIDDLPDGKYLCKTVADLVFEGIRPDSWETPEEAGRITKDLPQNYL